MRHIVIPIARNSCCNFSLRYSCQTDIYNFFFSGLQRTVLVSARRPSPMYKNPVWIWVKISLQVTCELLLFSELKNFASISHLETHRQLTIFLRLYIEVCVPLSSTSSRSFHSSPLPFMRPRPPRVMLNYRNVHSIPSLAWALVQLAVPDLPDAESLNLCSLSSLQMLRSVIKMCARYWSELFLKKFTSDMAIYCNSIVQVSKGVKRVIFFVKQLLFSHSSIRSLSWRLLWIREDYLSWNPSPCPDERLARITSQQSQRTGLILFFPSWAMRKIQTESWQYDKAKTWLKL